MNKINKIPYESMQYIIKYMNRRYTNENTQKALSKEIERLMAEAGLTKEEQEECLDFYRKKENRTYDKDGEVTWFRPFGEKDKMDTQQEINKIAQWMKEYNNHVSKTTGFVVGLSGGIDSAVIACLAVKAVGKENVIGVMMPCDSMQNTVEDAKALAKNLGIKNVMMGLYPTFEQLTNDLTTKAIPDCSNEYPNLNLSDRANGNIKARLRMVSLYAIAEANNYLVAGTGNKSELEVGYCTKYGDGGVDIEPIGNYYKTQVYKMAELMPEIPENVITKAPSADLWEGQTDEEELGMTYKELDKILSYSLHPHSGDYDSLLKEQGILEKKFNKVKFMRMKAEHKNNPPPRYIRYKL